MTYIIEFFRRRRGYFVCIVLLVFLLLNQGCKQKDSAQGSETSEEVTPDTITDDFVTFYDKFHTDSAYQMAHILFPLEGLPNAESDSDTIPTQRFFWQKEGWKKHIQFTDPSGQFEQWLEVINDRVIEHWVQMKGSNMFIHRRFAKLNDGWYLIYYAGLRPTKK